LIKEFNKWLKTSFKKLEAYRINKEI
jgi:hypothetical protein